MIYCKEKKIDLLHNEVCDQIVLKEVTGKHLKLVVEANAIHKALGLTFLSLVKINEIESEMQAEVKDQTEEQKVETMVQALSINTDFLKIWDLLIDNKLLFFVTKNGNEELILKNSGMVALDEMHFKDILKVVANFLSAIV